MKWAEHPEIEHALRQCVWDGLSAGETAARLAKQFRPLVITRNMVIGRAYRLGLRFHKGKSPLPKKVSL